MRDLGKSVTLPTQLNLRTSERDLESDAAYIFGLIMLRIPFLLAYFSGLPIACCHPGKVFNSGLLCGLLLRGHLLVGVHRYRMEGTECTST